jgi:hypothetical protein
MPPKDEVSTGVASVSRMGSILIVVSADVPIGIADSLNSPSATTPFLTRFT